MTTTTTMSMLPSTSSSKTTVRKSTRRMRGRPRSSTPAHPLAAIKQSSSAVALSKRQRSRQEHFKRQRRQIAFAARREKRSEWATIASDTQRIVLGDGKYVEERFSPNSLVASPIDLVFPSFQHSEVSTPHHTFQETVIHVIHDIAPQIILSNQGTTFYPHCSPDLANWRVPRDVATDVRPTKITFAPTSTLTAARRLHVNYPHLMKQSVHSLASTSIGVLSFASPKRPGGGFLHGGDEQEETIARSTSLVASLHSDQAQEFYRTHKKFLNVDGAGLHDHSMVYSPGVVAFRRDEDDDVEAVQAPSRPSRSGSTIRPYLINVLSSVPVNAAAIRQNYLITPSNAHVFEDGIRDKMCDRMARALRIFEIRGDRVLVLGAFGCGSSQNHVEMVAELWAELLVCGHRDTKEAGKEEVQPAKFKGVFEEVIFAVPGKLFESFKKAFEMKVYEMELTKAAS